ncbi:MAG: hypothetical protein COZ27_02495 [Candidatus Moranbacteria bacterium CG_4_10_14_3_um_filter_41_65]|nr:MAG: hypothetical protein COZ27_02495 [Candidatus Moranbacteria bacterium CG_4_10_14_3_um_filter_41_65]
MARHIANLRLAFLPSSLTNSLPFILGYSPCPPVSVCGTDTCIRTLEDFPGTPLPFLHLTVVRLRHSSWTSAVRIFLYDVLEDQTPIQ